jgi:multiple sugar transport system ATP-binding protein
MGRAIVRDPAVFLFDEPLSNLDAKLRVQMRAEIKRLQQTLAATTVYVTHDQIEAMTMADKIVVLREGLVEQIGSPLELYDRPANSFVASFIGSPAMNMLRGRLEAGEAPRLTLASGVTIPLREAPVAALGREVMLGVRPEHITVGGAASVNAQVSVIEPTGAETFVSATLSGAEIVCVLKERVSCRPGDTLALSFDAAPLHFFDAETGLAIRE